MSYVTSELKEALKNHVLVEVLPKAAGFQAFYLKGPGQSRMMSTLLVSTPEGISIMGDLCPGDWNGCISSFGYGFEWFAGELSEDYLCSKFLRKGYHATVAAKWVKSHIKEMEAAASGFVSRKWSDLLSDLESRELGLHEFHEALEELGFEREDEGLGYDPIEAGCLCCLQQRFSELYKLVECSK